MPAISFGGINSGLPPNLVDQLVEAEKLPIKNLERKNQKHQIKLGLIDDLSGRLSAIRGSVDGLAATTGFSDVKFISGDSNIVSGVVDPVASSSGSHNIEVIQLAQRAASLTNGFPDKDKTEIGVGYFTFETPEGEREVYISGENNTLEGAAAAINAEGLGLKASVINDRKSTDRPFKLMITGEGFGSENNVSYPTLYFLDGDQDIFFNEEREARNGVVKVDGFEFEVSGNSVDDLIPGVTLELRQEAPGRSVNITIKEDQEAVTVKSMNLLRLSMVF